MDPILEQLRQDLSLSERSVDILTKSVKKSETLLASRGQRTLTDDERETLESLTSRFARALDLLTQKLLRTIDKIELTDDGTPLDRMNRFKKRGVLRDDINYGQLKDLRNRIVHEYIIEESDKIVADCLANAHLVTEIYLNAKSYCLARGHIKN